MQDEVNPPSRHGVLITPEGQVPKGHLLRVTKVLLDGDLRGLGPLFEKMYAVGRQSNRATEGKDSSAARNGEHWPDSGWRDRPGRVIQ